MFSRSQITTLLLLSAALWGAATLYIRIFPARLLDPVWGSLSFLTTIGMSWLSVVLVRKAAGLRRDQLLSGIAVVGAAAMMLDGVILHWWSALYTSDERTARLAASWLLWGYGVSFGIAFLMAREERAVEMG